MTLNKNLAILQFFDGFARMTVSDPSGTEHSLDFPVESEQRYFEVWHVVHSREDGEMPEQCQVRPDLWADAVRLKQFENEVWSLNRGDVQ